MQDLRKGKGEMEKIPKGLWQAIIGILVVGVILYAGITVLWLRNQTKVRIEEQGPVSYTHLTLPTNREV